MTLQLAWEEYRSHNPTGISYVSPIAIIGNGERQLKSVCARHIDQAKVYSLIFVGVPCRFVTKTLGMNGRPMCLWVRLERRGILFAVAVNSQKVMGFHQCARTKCWNKIDGVPKYIVTDNLKSAVIKNTKDVTELNRAYAELAEYYDFMIVPARPRKPKTKHLQRLACKLFNAGYWLDCAIKYFLVWRS